MAGEGDAARMVVGERAGLRSGGKRGTRLGTRRLWHFIGHGSAQLCL